ncbi:HK97 family phage prohead protease [Elizabethkingia anophelis]|nr:HK97 family phage prohead protease [Elizabethkingia anophelis]
MKGILELKDFVGSVKDIDTKNRIVTGYLTAFGNKDHDGDIGEYGMFTKTIAENGPKGKNTIFFLNQHEWKQPHCKFAVLEEHKEGLYFESNKLPNTSYSNDVIELYAEKILTEHSYGYVTTKSIFDKEQSARRLKEVRLFEGSNVTLGANPNTPFTGFKNYTIDQLNQKSSDIIKILRNGNLTDDTFIQLELALKMLQLEAYELGKTENTQTVNEPSADTQLKGFEPLIDTISNLKLNI